MCIFDNIKEMIQHLVSQQLKNVACWLKQQEHNSPRSNAIESKVKYLK